MYRYVYLNIYIYICTHMYIYIHVYTYTYTSLTRVSRAGSRQAKFLRDDGKQPCKNRCDRLNQ